MSRISHAFRFCALSFYCVAFSLIATVAMSAAASAQNAVSVVSDARVAGDLARTRFILDMDGEVGYNLSFLSHPYRLVIDLPSVTFQFPRDFVPKGRGLVRSWRYGSISKERSRVVLDLNSPVALDKTFLLPGVQDQPTRLVIDLTESSPDEFEAAVGQATSHAQPVGATASVPKQDTQDPAARAENDLP